MDYQIGSTIGDYQVVGMLGAGGMGKVYKVRNVISDRIEAMKVLLPDLSNEPELADRFLREIQVQASLKHPNIAALHTALRVDNRLLMLMEFLEGETLEQKLKGGPIATGLAVDYMMQALSALEYAHAHGVIHRDIKPANMMLTSGGVVKLMDFGIAKAAADRKLTMTGTTVGSLYYMSPEQIQGSANLDARSDLYSLGVTLYELVTGKHPFDGDSQFSIMSAHLQNTPTPPIALDPKLPQVLNDIILLSVTKDPERRFQTAAAFRNALSSVTAAPAPVAAAPAPVAAAPGAAKAASARPKDDFHLIEPTAPAKPSGKRGLWMALGAVAAVAVVIAAIEFGPWTHAARSVAPSVATPEVVSAPAPAPAVQPEPTAAPASPSPTPAPPVSETPAPAPSKASTPAPPPSRQNPASSNRQPERTVHTASPAVATPPAAQQTAPPPAAPSASIPQPPAQPATNAASRAELQQIREQLAMLGSRAAGIHTSLQTLQRSQAASGLNLRGDMQEAATLMNTYLEGSAAALNAGDSTAAKSFLEKAERQAEKLEKFLNR